MIFNQPKIETVPTIDICWFTSKFSLTKLFRHYEASFMDWELRHTQIDQRYLVQKCIFELNVFICLLTSFEVQPSFESVSDEKIIDTKFLQSLLLLKIGTHCAFKIYWSVDNSLQLDKNELSSTKIEFFSLLNLYESLLGFLMEDNK